MNANARAVGLVAVMTIPLLIYIAWVVNDTRYGLSLLSEDLDWKQLT